MPGMGAAAPPAAAGPTPPTEAELKAIAAEAALRSAERVAAIAKNPQGEH